MDQHGAAWSEKDTKREPKATQMDPKGYLKNKNKQSSEKDAPETVKIASRTLPGVWTHAQK
jgi:hypothetical protein